MSYLFLSFIEHLNENSKSKVEFYNLSLHEQYNNLLLRVPLERRVKDFSKFIEICFPSGFPKNYFISCPNFLREKKQNNEKSVSYLNNVVIRSELTDNMKRYLPANQNIILVGDICEGEKLKMMIIKGIHFIDESMSSPHDLLIRGSACNCFSKDYRKYRVWSINHVDYENTYFTPDNIKTIIDKCYIISNPEQITKTYNEWK